MSTTSVEFSVTFADGRTVRASTRPGDLVRMERKFGAVTDADTTAEQAFFLAWSALHRQGDFEGDFEVFLDEVEDFDSDAVPLDQRPRS